MTKLFAELRRRNVFRVAGVYAVVGWLLIQVIVAVKSPLHLPDWTDTFFVVLVLAGFPVALILAWAFEMTPEGVRLTANVAEGDSTAPKTGRKLDFAILSGLTLVGVMIVANRLVPGKPAQSQPIGNGALTVESAAPEVSAASIAVLPFADLSPARDQEYFSDGMAEEILNVLAKVNGLTVASRTSSFAFKGQETLGVPAMANELRVRHVLEGSVRKSGDAIRITAQLIDAETDAHLWSETYDRKLTAENIFALQDEIAQSIVGALSGIMKIDNAQTPAVGVEKATSDLSAYELFLKARANYQRRDNFEETETLLAEAVRLDPNFTDAWALRAANISLFKEYLATDRSWDDVGKLVDAYADRTLALNPDNARAIAARANFRITAAWSLALKFDIGAIFADLNRAVALDPRDSSAMNWLGMTYALVGESRKSLETFRACASFDPYFGPCTENVYDLLVVNGRYDEALEQYEDVLSKGITVSGWANFDLLAHSGEKVAFMQATNHPAWLPGWRRHKDLYEAFRRPEGDHSALIAELRDYVRGRPQRGVNPSSNLLIPIGDHDATPYLLGLWTQSYSRYRKSPQFKTYIRNSGVYDYWRKYGFPQQCRPVGPQNSENADFECD